MENENTEYKNDLDDPFIEYVFSKDPKDKGTIKLELGNPNNISLSKHIYEQLLQIFVDGLKYLYGEDNKVNITSLEIENIILIKKYFLSFNIDLSFEMFNVDNYVSKPYIYGNKTLEEKFTNLSDYYYEVEVIKEDIIMFYRISFTFI